MRDKLGYDLFREDKKMHHVNIYGLKVCELSVHHFVHGNEMLYIWTCKTKLIARIFHSGNFKFCVTSIFVSQNGKKELFQGLLSLISSNFNLRDGVDKYLKFLISRKI